jgi:hypothetical protein
MRPVGRPRKTLADLPENWKQIMLDLAQDGDGPTAWKVYLGLGYDTYNTLLTDYEEFSTAVREADALHLMYYERQGKRMINGGAGNSNVYAMVMVNKFGHRSARSDNTIVATVEAKVEQTNKALTADELKKELELRGLPTAVFVGVDGD